MSKAGLKMGATVSDLGSLEGFLFVSGVAVF